MLYDSNELKIIFLNGTALVKKVLDKAVATKALNTEDIDNLYKMISEVCTNPPVLVFDVLHQNQPEDDVVYAHSFNVAIISQYIADWSNFEEDEKRKLLKGALMHDIGKLFVDDDILNKEDKLSHSEKAQVSSHTVEGYKEFRKSGLDTDILSSILMHHERIDGSGYPLGLHGEKINKYARIVAIADKYEGMTSRRRYRKPSTPLDALEHINDIRIRFDKNYIAAFLDNMYSFISDKKTDIY